MVGQLDYIISACAAEYRSRAVAAIGVLLGMGWRGEEDRVAVAEVLRQALRAKAVRWGAASPLPDNLPLGDGQWLAECWPPGGGDVRVIVDPTATERLSADSEVFTLVDLLADSSVGLGPVLFVGSATEAPRQELPAPEIILDDGGRIRRPANMTVLSRWLPSRMGPSVEKALILDPEAVGAALSGDVRLPFAAVLRARSTDPRVIARAWAAEDVRNAPDLAVWNLCRQEGLQPPVLVVGKEYLQAFPVGDVRWHRGAERRPIGDVTKGEPTFSSARTFDAAAPIGEPAIPPAPPRLAELPKPGPRWLNAGLHSFGRGSRPVVAFAENKVHWVEIWVGRHPPRGDRSQPTFPDHLLTGRPEGDWVRVIVTEPKHLPEAVVGWLKIPPTGETRPVRLRLPPMQAGRFDGRVLICRGSRILQTARLKAAILPEGVKNADDEFRFDIEAVIDPSLGDRRTDFDAAFVINDTHGEPQLTSIKGDAIDVTPLGDDHIEFLRLLQNRLDQLVENKFKGLTSTPAEVWYMLAHQGADLFANIVGRQLKDAGEGQRFQIISAKPDGFLPLEYVYQFDPPEEGAGLCPQAQTALMGGCSDCTDEKREANVCPLGFWGVTKTIERHVFNAEDPDRPLDHYRVFCDEDGERPPFGAIDASLLGASKVVEELASGRKALAKLQSSLAMMTPRAAETVNDWTAWTNAVAKTKPQILVLLSHTYIDEVAQKPGLEIGDNARRIKTRIRKSLVGDGNVIVLLLGCSTMNTANRCHDFHLAFCDAGADVVIGTLSKTLGTYAAEAAEEIVAQLTDPGRPATIGEVLKGVRRRLLANGRLIGLSIIAFGDADWKLGGTV